MAIKKLPLNAPYSFINYLRIPIILKRKFSTKQEAATDDPIKFSTSEAKGYSSIDTFINREDLPPKYQMPSVLISVSAFLLYFLVFREENDWDEELVKPLYDKVPGLLESDYNARIKMNKELGLDTDKLKKEFIKIKETKNV